MKIERKSAEYFQEKKYGKSLATLMEIVHPPGLKRSFVKFLIRLMGKMAIGKVKYPNDFQIEVRADREMNFRDRLSEIKASTLILCGESDIGYSADDVRTTAEGIPNSELKLYEGHGHGLFMFNRKQVLANVLEFLKK